MKRRYLRAIPVLSMLILCQAVSFMPTKADVNADVLETFTIESLVESVSDVFTPSVYADDWETQPVIVDGEHTDAWNDAIADGGTEGKPTTTPTTPTTPTQDGKIVNNTKDILIVVNGSILGLDVPPFILDNRTFLPTRAVAESLGCKVDWNNATKSFTITSKDGKTVIQGVAGKSEVTVNGKKVLIDKESDRVTVQTRNNRVMVPIRFFAENLGCEVNYQDRVVYITTK